MTASCAGDDGGGGNPGDDGSGGGDDASSADDTVSSSVDTGQGTSDSGPHPGVDAGNWVDMTNDPAACEHRDGVPCGWSATNNGAGDTCACRHGNWAEGWTCEAPNAPTTAGASCPGVVGDAAVGDAATVDATAGGDAGGWVDMTNNAAACDLHPGTPCGWNPTPNNTGYTCGCRHGDWADGWTCEPTGTAVTPGPSCPADGGT